MNVCELTEYAEIVGRGITPAYTEDGGLLVLNQKCVRGGRVTLSLARKHDVRARSVASVKLLQAGDIVVNSTGVGTLGRTAMWREEAPATADSHVTIVRPVSANPVWLSYAMLLAEPEIVAMAKGSTGQTELGREQLGHLGVPKMPRREQDAIAEVLGALDDKIAANRRVLYKAAELVRLRVEGRLDVAEVHRVGDVAEFLNRRRVPLSRGQREARSGNVPYYGAAGQLDDVDEPLFDEPLVLVGEDGTVVTEDGRAVVQYIWGPAWVNNHAHVLRGTAVKTSLLRWLLARTEVRHLVTGAVQPKISMGNLKTLELALPRASERRGLESECDLFAAQERAMKDQIKTLAKARDELLPLLMSGKITVKDAEKRVEGVV